MGNTHVVCPEWSGQVLIGAKILVHRDSEVKSFQDLVGKRFAFHLELRVLDTLP